MKTSCFYLYSGEGRISIARTSPKHVLEGLKYYPSLTPGKWLFDPAYSRSIKTEIIGAIMWVEAKHIEAGCAVMHETVMALPM